MPENTRMATLNQETIRRMINTSELVDMGTRLQVIDDYARKLINSEYDLAMTRRIIVGGLKGYERMLSGSLNKDSPGWKPLHLPTSYKAKERRISKMMAKTNWFKSREEQGLESNKQLDGTSGYGTGRAKVMEPTGDRAGVKEGWSKKRERKDQLCLWEAGRGWKKHQRRKKGGKLTGSWAGLESRRWTIIQP